MIDIMGPLLDRPTIKKDFDEKYPVIIDRMHEMLDEAKLMYDNQVWSLTSNLHFVLSFADCSH